MIRVLSMTAIATEVRTKAGDLKSSIIKMSLSERNVTRACEGRQGARSEREGGMDGAFSGLRAKFFEKYLEIDKCVELEHIIINLHRFVRDGTVAAYRAIPNPHRPLHLWSRLHTLPFLLTRGHADYCFGVNQRANYAYRRYE